MPKQVVILFKGWKKELNLHCLQATWPQAIWSSHNKHIMGRNKSVSPGGVVCIHRKNLKIQYRKEKIGICDALKLLNSANESSRNVGECFL